MTTLDKAIIAFYERNGNRFEIYVDPDAAYAYVEGRKNDLKNILVSDEVYSDAKKAEKAKAEPVLKTFGTHDIFTILEFILKNGEVQLTTEQRRKKIDEKRKQIIALLLRESIDPRTNAPHTLMRIENALEEARVKFDPFKDARDQLPDIIKELRLILPLKFDKIKIAIKIGPEYAHKSYGAVKTYGIMREQWTNDGSLIAVIEIFAGMQGEVYDRLNKLTNGTVETKKVEGSMNI
ncbi:MAG: ribosome assembly factor SBDS [Candidatus Micrarchaeota archaeon]|nr:ribosome assembly factor SBDS [Candidatus Micrarchaeota archaeon]